MLYEVITYAIKDMAEDMVGLMKELGIKKSHFIGISMGGMICQEFAINHPELVHKLILTGTSAANELASFDPINIWNFVKQNDKEGLTFAQQQFIWLFSDSFLRNHKAVEHVITSYSIHYTKLYEPVFCKLPATPD